MRLPYFPDLRPDEILYSLLARHGRHTAATRPGEHMTLLFGRCTTVATVDLPGHVAELAARLDPALGLDADALIDRATLFPYYSAHQPHHVRSMVRAEMREGNASTIHHRLGIPAFRIPRPSLLLFCPECLLCQLGQYGEAHWLRSHQAPGLVVCPSHGIPLRESTVRPGTASRHGYVAAGPGVCLDGTPLVAQRVGAAATELLMALGSKTAGLLTTIDHPCDLTEWRDIYRARLDAIGLMRSRHKVDQVRLTGALADFYAGVLGFLPRACGRLGPGGWPEQIVRYHRKAFHPLLHIMLQVFLERSSIVASPFGQPPWPCINPLAQHRGQPLIDVVDRHRNRDMLVGAFSCRCGYVYTRCVHADGRLGEPRMRSVGPLFEPTLRRLLVPGCTLRGVAKALGVDPKTLMREAASLGVPVDWKTRPSGSPRQPPKAVTSRSEGDRRRGSGGQPRRDWPALDRELVVQFRREASLILKAAPPVRLTLVELERRLGLRGWLRKRRDKLPASNAAVGLLCESVEEFRRRRVRYVLATSRFGDDLRPWRVMRLAGVTAAELKMIEEEITSHDSSEGWVSA